MKASFLDLRRRMREVLRALDRNEPVTILYRGKEKAILVPAHNRGERQRVAEHHAFGMWADHKDMRDVAAFIRGLRQGRGHAL